MLRYIIMPIIRGINKKQKNKTKIYKIISKVRLSI